MNQLIFGVPLRYILCFCIHHSIFFLPLICDKTGQVTGDVLNTSVWVVIHFPWYCAFMHACKHGSSLSPKPEPRAEQSTMMINPVCVRLIECRSQSVVGPETIAGSNHVKGAAGHHDPMDIVLLPTKIWRMEGTSEGHHKEGGGRA